MLKIRRPLGRLIFNMGIAIPGKTVFLIETAPWINFKPHWRGTIINQFINIYALPDLNKLRWWHLKFSLDHHQNLNVLASLRQATSSSGLVDKNVRCGSDTSLCTNSVKHSKLSIILRQSCWFQSFNFKLIIYLKTYMIRCKVWHWHISNYCTYF